MAIKPSQIQTILQRKRDQFQRFDRSWQSSLAVYQERWQQLCGAPADELDQWLTSRPDAVGSRPLQPLPAPCGICPSGLQWSNRQSSLAWVEQQLSGVTTFAVDGSQVFPSKDLSLPVALVQVGWFENPHHPDRPYAKDIELDVMTPRDLETTSTAQPLERKVNQRRFQMETQRLVRYIQQVKEPERCLVFFDGSLVATFAEAYGEADRMAYVDALTELIEASETHRVPLVGYVDTSAAHDLTNLLVQRTPSLAATAPVTDARLLNRYMAWGDSTPIFQCDRGGILAAYGAHGRRICFTYLKTNQGDPARIEMPLWMYEAGITEQVLHWVRAETVVGGGYPYAIETADQTAVLQSRDRQVFFRILQDWAAQERLTLGWSRKMMSKRSRR